MYPAVVMAAAREYLSPQTNMSCRIAGLPDIALPYCCAYTSLFLLVSSTHTNSDPLPMKFSHIDCFHSAHRISSHSDASLCRILQVSPASKRFRDKVEVETMMPCSMAKKVTNLSR